MNEENHTAEKSENQAMTQLKRCIVEPISEIFEAARLLDEAVSAHLKGRFNEAERLIRQANMWKIHEWSEKMWGTLPIEWSGHDPNPPPPIPEEQRAPKYIPTDIKRKILTRDGYICRFCGIPVIDKEAKKILKKAYPEALPFEINMSNEEKHKAFQAMDWNPDHLLPRSRGGVNTQDNLVVACAPCNCGRGEKTLADMKLEDPRCRPVRGTPLYGPDGWMGLTQLIF